MPKTKKIPLRKCTGCGDMKPKKELIRVLHTPEDTVIIDKTGKKNGRGAYLCDDPECLKKAIKRKALNRAFRKQAAGEAAEQLTEQLGGEYAG